MEEVLRPLSGHAVLILLLQAAGLLLLARVLAEAMRRIKQPAVIGELLAGLLLGPTVLGHLAPDLFVLVFPRETAQFHLLEVVSWLGMVLLLLLTGLETDIRTMRHLGRPALMASVFGMVVPFAGGLGLGWLLPDRFLVDTALRPVFAAFLATAMAISAMPVIAKILIDLDLIRRKVGMVILSASVVDDTAGWVILSVIAGIAAGGAFSLTGLGLTLLGLGMFLTLVRWVAFPALVRSIRYLNEEVDLAGADITLILVFTFVAAAITEAIGIHAVFGAFVAGLAVRQVPRVNRDAVQTIEIFVLSALSPIFFASVGLRVDLWQLTAWKLPLLVIGIAVAGKLVGCYLGGRLGRLSHWESLALGFGMNARGAMELIVAMIGLSLGLLTQEMYSTIVMVAVVTSFIAPLLLRWALPRIPVSEDERQRIEDGARQTLLPEGPLRVLVPTAGGENAMEAMRFAAPLARRNHGQVTALFVEVRQEGEHRRWQARRRPSLAGTNLDHHLTRAAGLVSDGGGGFEVRRMVGRDVASAVLKEASRDYDLVALGAAPNEPLHDPLSRRIIEASPVPVVLVRHGEDVRSDGPFRRILVPVDGGRLSRYAAEVAFACAAATDAEVTVLHVADPYRLASGSLPIPERGQGKALARDRTREIRRQIEQGLGPLAATHGVRMQTRIFATGSPDRTIIEESRSGQYDLLILGSEDRMLGWPMFFGQGTAEILERSRCTTAVLLGGTI